MSARNDGGPAFPREDYQTNGAPKDQPFYLGQEGMSLRDYFAAKAMQGFMANKANPMHFQPHDDAAWAYSIADAMLKAREA